jgi:GDPmannose 4,6-dehydratase
MKKAIITGVKGQDGALLSKLMLSKGYTIYGCDLPGANERNLRYLDIDKSVQYIDVDLLDLSNVIRMIERYEPDEIYNLAAQSSVGLSFDQPIGTIELNIISVANLLEAIKILKVKTKFYQASSSEMFGNVRRENLPIKEDHAFHPASPYGISKAASHWLTVNYRESYHIFAVSGILFNHESALRGRQFVTKKIINTAVKISMGLADELYLGNMNIYRDWGYAPYYVEAMWLMLQQNDPSDYIICSGEAHSLQEYAEGVFSLLNLDFEKYVRIDKNLYRPMDMDIIYGNSDKAKDKLKWHYNMKFTELISNLVAEERRLIEWEMRNQK